MGMGRNEMGERARMPETPEKYTRFDVNNVEIARKLERPERSQTRRETTQTNWTKIRATKKGRGEEK